MPVDYDEELEGEFEHARLYKTTVDFDPTRMKSHFDTCSSADEHRKAKQPVRKDFYETRGADEW